jgi:hypothetical protein
MTPSSRFCEPRFATTMLEVVDEHVVHVEHCAVVRLLRASVAQVFTKATIASWLCRWRAIARRHVELLANTALNADVWRLRLKVIRHDPTSREVEVATGPR